MKKKLFLLCFLLSVVGIYAQQNSDKKFSHWSITLEGGLNRFDGDIKQKYNEIIPNALNKFSYGGSLEYTLTPVWSMGLEYYYLPLEAKADYYSVKNKMHSVDYFMAFNLLKAFYKNTNTKWGLWATIGGGICFYSVDYLTANNGKGDVKIGGYFGPDDNYKIDDGRALTVPLGMLIEYNFSKNFALGTKFQYRSYNKDNLDGRNLFGVTNDFVQLGTLQLRWKFDAKNKNHTRNINVALFNDDITRKDLDAVEKKVDKLNKDMLIVVPEVERLKSTLPNLENRVKKLEDIICPDGPDTDGDGVPDCRDKEPNTPAGNQVDFWGRTIKSGGSSIDESAFIYFDFDKTDLDAEARKAIDIAAKKLQAYPSLVVEVRGFTDNMGTTPYNNDLSQRRADKVRNELVKTYGIEPNRVIANGKGKFNSNDKTIPFRPYRTCILFYNK